LLGLQLDNAPDALCHLQIYRAPATGIAPPKRPAAQGAARQGLGSTLAPADRLEAVAERLEKLDLRRPWWREVLSFIADFWAFLTIGVLLIGFLVSLGPARPFVDRVHSVLVTETNRFASFVRHYRSSQQSPATVRTGGTEKSDAPLRRPSPPATANPKSPP
jgi:hypothetical protein